MVVICPVDESSRKENWSSAFVPPSAYFSVSPLSLSEAVTRAPTFVPELLFSGTVRLVGSASSNVGLALLAATGPLVTPLAVLLGEVAVDAGSW